MIYVKNQVLVNCYHFRSISRKSNVIHVHLSFIICRIPGVTSSPSTNRFTGKPPSALINKVKLFFEVFLYFKSEIHFSDRLPDLSSPPTQVNFAVVTPKALKRNSEILASTLSYSEMPWKLQLLQPFPEQLTHGFCF